MQIRLQSLEHQQNALKAVVYVFKGVHFDYDVRMESNPVFDPSDPNLRANILQLQSGGVDGVSTIAKGCRQRVDDGVLGIDIKMETGTGKTLAYTQLMYELYEHYGLNKFIILVPSTPIREGTKAFIESDYAKRYFDDEYRGDNLALNLDILEAQKGSRGRKLFPTAISNFVEASRLTKGRISALLMTDGMLRSNRTMGIDYDQTVLGFSSVPYEALRETRPIIIVDEPHRFRRENVAYQTILTELQPQAVIRFGATFPENPKTKKPDYNNLIFNLGAIEAINGRLVKGVAIEYPDMSSADATRLRLVSLSASTPRKATFQDAVTSKSFTWGVGDSLADSDSAFAGITIEGIGRTENPQIKSGVTLSNGHILGRGDILPAGVYSDTYQALMMKQALDVHFEKEWENFRRTNRIKTLSLFFIDSIDSYRGPDGQPGHLRTRFEELLEAKLKQEMRTRELDDSPISRQYLEYLKASLADLSATNGGYFSADNSTRDDDIRKEVDQILRDKQGMLSFKDADGNPNTMRFIFSKWTLREGWDNPNVFQIVKLRSSGSEISKLQEVGRGLRLPVDTSGSRLSDEQFYLTYLVDYTEKDFAKRLTTEVNVDSMQGITSIKDLLPKVAKKYGLGETELFIELLQDKLVDKNQEVLPGKEDELFAKYPEFGKNRLLPGKVIDRGKKAKVGIRKEQYAQLKDLWETVNAKYYLRLDRLSSAELDKCMDYILGKNIYRTEFGRVAEDRIVESDKGKLEVKSSTKSRFELRELFPYNEWLKQAHLQTGLPMDHIHAGLVRANKQRELPSDFFNKTTLKRFVAEFGDWMQAEFLNRFSYERIGGIIGETSLTDEQGNAKSDIVQGNIGVHRANDEQVPEKFLYDAVVYDSLGERRAIKDSGAQNVDEVVVYGKIPRRSIQVPVYFGGSTSPDFMYVLNREDGTSSLNFIIEAKDYDQRSDMRISEMRRIESARKFFETMESNNVNVKFGEMLETDDVVQMIRNVLADDSDAV